MAVATAYASCKSVAEAVFEIREKLANVDSVMVIYFASSVYEQHELSAAMHGAFPKAKVFGCSTAGEIVSGKMLKKSIVAMAFSKEVIADVSVEVLPQISANYDLKSVFSSFEDHYRVSMKDADPEQYVGIVLFDGLSCAEERVMDKIGDGTNVTFIGGSAGDDLQFAATHVYANGKAYTNAAVLALMKPAGRFSIIKTQSFSDFGKKLVATKVDESIRTVFEFDGKAASQAYAEAIGQSVKELPEYFMNHPLGLIAEGEPFVRSPQQVKDGAVCFYCNVMEGMELQVLQSTDIIKETEKALKDLETKMGGLKALLNFNCILRTLQLDSEGKAEQYGRIFEEIPTIGFSTYGEAYIGHINQTATMLVFA
jgi:hypothetical protein